VSHGPTLQVLGLGLGFKVLIIPFIVCHMATQQLLNIITNATAGPWNVTFVINSSKVKVCHYSYMCNLIGNINHCLAHIWVPYTPTPTLTNVHYTYHFFIILH
jgi:hypothetical protein